MDWVAWKEKLAEVISKYKFVILILCIGILLMTFPNRGKTQEPEIREPEFSQERLLNEELEEILSQIDGVGKVRVMLTESAGAETVYQTDTDRSDSDNSESLRQETVIISGGSQEQGLVRSITPPIYLGAIVVCQGGGDPAVRLAIVQAVSSVTGIGSDRISVLKMK